MTQQVGDFLKWMAEGKSVRRPEWLPGEEIRQCPDDKGIQCRSPGKSWNHVGFLHKVTTSQLFATDWEVVKFSNAMRRLADK